jgi:hypothetical protein
MFVAGIFTEIRPVLCILRGKEKGRERGIWDCCILLSVVHSPSPPPPPPLPYPARHFTCLWLWLSGLEAQGGAPTPSPPIPIPLLDSLRLQWWFSRIASNLEAVSMKTDIGQ